MAVQQNWQIDYSGNVPVVLDNDCTRGQVAKRTTTSTNTADVAGAGEVPAGVFIRSVDISEEGTSGEIMTKGFAVCKVGATAVTSFAIPLKPAASGVVIPADTDKDFCIGYPENLAEIGADVRVRLMPGIQYTV